MLINLLPRMTIHCGGENVKIFDEKKDLTDTVQVKLFPFTSGYDLHFVIAEGQEERAEMLHKLCRDYLDKYLGENGNIVYDRTFDKPVGPWQSPMWFIEICTVDRLNDPANPHAADPEKLTPLFEFMRQTRQYLKNEMKKLGMPGTLFIHANTLPHNSDMVYERKLHLEHSWITGESVTLTDIWGESNGLIAQEAFIKDRLKLGEDDSTIITAFQQHFKGIKSPEALSDNAKMLLQGQHLLQAIQSPIQEITSPSL